MYMQYGLSGLHLKVLSRGVGWDKIQMQQSLRGDVTAKLPRGGGNGQGRESVT